MKKYTILFLFLLAGFQIQAKPKAQRLQLNRFEKMRRDILKFRQKKAHAIATATYNKNVSVLSSTKSQLDTGSAAALLVKLTNERITTGILTIMHTSAAQKEIELSRSALDDIPNEECIPSYRPPTPIQVPTIKPAPRPAAPASIPSALMDIDSDSHALDDLSSDDDMLPVKFIEKPRLLPKKPAVTQPQEKNKTPKWAVLEDSALNDITDDEE